MKSFYKVSITAVTYNRLTHLLSGNSILAVIHSLKIFVGIEFFSYAEFFRPSHVVCPWRVGLLQKMYIRYISNFGKGGNLVRRGSFYKLCVFFTVIGCCVFRQIYVHGDNINEVISRVYAFCRTVPYPYKVVDVQYICIVRLLCQCRGDGEPYIGMAVACNRRLAWS